MKYIKLVDIMEKIAIENDISQLETQIKELEVKILKLQAELNVKKFQLNRDNELLDIKNMKFEE